jgi:hypothetical protein
VSPAGDPAKHPLHDKQLLGSVHDQLRFLPGTAGGGGDTGTQRGDHKTDPLSTDPQAAGDLTAILNLEKALTQGQASSFGGSQQHPTDGVGAGFGTLDEQQKQQLKDLLNPDSHKH